MIIDINPLLKGDKTEIHINYSLSIEEGIEDIEFPENFSVTGTVKDMAGYITLTLEADVPYSTVCSRCLAPIQTNKIILLDKTVVTEQTGIQNEDNDDYIISKDGFIDADDTLIEQILLELPLKHLCKDDCKGLCPKCGADLNITQCGCETKEPDPRFDVLRKLLEDNKKN